MATVTGVHIEGIRPQLLVHTERAFGRSYWFTQRGPSATATGVHREGLRPHLLVYTERAFGRSY